MNLKYVLVLAVIVFMSVNSYAGNFDFQLTSTSISTCPCSTQEIIGTITNEDSSTHTYELKADSLWATITPNTFKLSSGETKTIYIYITPTCFETNAGNYQIKITSDDGEDTKNRYIDVQVLRCSEVRLSVNSNDVYSCKNQDVKVPITIENRGEVEEVFDVRTSKGFLSKDEIVLKSGEKETVDLIYSVIDSNENAVVKAVSQNSYAEDAETIRFHGMDCYVPDVEVLPTQKNVCVGQAFSLDVNVYNRGTKDDSYDLSSNFGWFDKKSVSVKSGENETIKLHLKFDQSGKYPVNVRADSIYAGDKDSAEINVVECRGLAVIALPREMKSCNLDNVRYLVSVKNIGTKDSWFKISSNMGRLGAEKMFLAPGESNDTVLDIDVSNLTLTGDNTLKNVTVYVESEDGLIKDMHTSLLNITHCFDAELKSNVREIDVCEGKDVELSYNVKNTGIKEDTYVLRLDGENEEEEFLLKPGQEKEVIINHQEPLNSEVRSKEIKVVLESENGVYRYIPLKLNIKPKEECYDYDVFITPEEITGKEYKGYVYKINVENNGKYEDKYSVDLAGPEWVYIEPKEMDLESGDNDYFYLYASPDVTTKSGEYYILVTVSNQEGMKKTLKAKFVFEGEKERIFAKGTEMELREYKVDVDKDKEYLVSPEKKVEVELSYTKENGINRRFNISFGASSFVVRIGDTVVADDNPQEGYNEYKLWVGDKLYDVVVNIKDIDEYRQEYTFTLDSVRVKEYVQVEKGELVDEGKGVDWTLWILVVLIIVLILLTVYYLLFLRRKDNSKEYIVPDESPRKIEGVSDEYKVVPQRCKGVTKSGERCKRLTTNPNGYCDIHQDQAGKEKETSKKVRKEVKDEIREILDKI